MSTVTLALLGDTHFGQEDPPVVDALLADLRAQAPQLVVVAGDLTQRARRREFHHARQFLAALPAPAVTIPGNHDLPLFDLASRLIAPYRRYRRYISHELEPTVVQGALGVIGVDATRRLRHAHGVLDRALVERSVRRLRALPTPFRMVVVHQPLAAGQHTDRRKLARGHEHAVAAFVEAGADLLVGGHVHRAYTLTVGRHRRAVLVQAGTAVSRRRRHGLPNSYYRITLHEEPGEPPQRRMVIERRDHQPEAEGFVGADKQYVVCGPRGWQLG